MKCANCNRPLSTAALRVGRLNIGPVCAKKMGLVKPRKSKASIAVRDEDVRQISLELI